MAATGTWAMSSPSARIGVPRVRARHPRRSVSRMMGRMNDIAIEEMSSHPEEDPADFGVERGVPFTRKNSLYRVESAQARDLAILLAAVMSDEAVAASSSTFRDAERISGGEAALDAAKQKLLESPPEPSFAKKNPSWEGVCMGNRKTCTCGAPFFG